MSGPFQPRQRFRRDVLKDRRNVHALSFREVFQRLWNELLLQDHRQCCPQLPPLGGSREHQNGCQPGHLERGNEELEGIQDLRGQSHGYPERPDPPQGTLEVAIRGRDHNTRPSSRPSKMRPASMGRLSPHMADLDSAEAASRAAASSSFELPASSLAW